MSETNTTNIRLRGALVQQAKARIPTAYGSFDMYAYASTPNDPMPHIAFVSVDMRPQEAVPVRIHSECMTGDVFGSRRCDCGEQLDAALRIAAEQGGIVVYLRQEGRGIGLINKLKAYNLQDEGLNTIDANTHMGFEADARQYEAAVTILKDLGITQVKLMTNNPDKVIALQRSEIVVVGRIPILVTATADNQDYLRTKQDLMGHILGLS